MIYLSSRCFAQVEFLIGCVAGNEIGAEGAKAIGEMLKTNKTVTVVRLWSELIIKNYCRDAHICGIILFSCYR